KEVNALISGVNEKIAILLFSVFDGYWDIDNGVIMDEIVYLPRIRENKLSIIITLIVVCACNINPVPDQFQNPDSGFAGKDSPQIALYSPKDTLKNTLFVPDSTINNKVMLRDQSSLSKFIGDYRSLE